ncbi:MAG: hypothetical protein DWQ01_10175 [Planctomycetota bacterium]|nr:MAG: hypothetical protein DWQ01_10175 [Planctomycetota bacterium]
MRFRERYELLQPLGAGGQGEVWLAKDENGLEVAVKRIAAVQSQSARLRLEREAIYLRRVDHPNVAKVLNLLDEDGALLLVMNYVEGSPLSALIDPDDAEAYPPRSQTKLDQVLDLFAGLADALNALHEVEIVHRDVKPANVIVTQNGQPVLVDLGLAHTEGVTRLSQAHDPPGTWLYMSPEQTRGEEVDARSDLFSLGICLYECLTQRLPFNGFSQEEVFTSIRRDEPAALKLGFGVYDRALNAVIAKMLEKDPARRYSTAAQVAADLRRIRTGEKPLARAPGTLRVLARRIQREPSVRRLFLGLIAAIVLLSSISWALASRNRVIAAELDLVRIERDVDMFVEQRRLKAFEEGLQRLEPPWPTRIPELTHWLEQTRAAVARFEALHQELDLKPPDGQDDKRFRELRDQQARLEAHIERHERDGCEKDGNEIFATSEELRAHLVDLGMQLRRIQFEIRSYVSSELPVDDVYVLQADHAEFSARLFAATDPEYGLIPRIEQLLSSARRLKAIEADHFALWNSTIRSIEKTYDGFRIPPQPGLVPLGPDPQSGLHEFADILSAAPDSELPERDPQTGRITIDQESGVVFVLVPGGNATIGSLRGSSDQPFHEPKEFGEVVGVLAEVALAPFLISKYEVTQAQWLRMAGENPSYWRPGRAGGREILVHPVDQITWVMADLVLPRFGMMLPTEAQWEYACRAGTTTPWYTGANPSTLIGHGNLNLGKRSQSPIRVGSLKPNPWGLHDLYGNVQEWTSDHPIQASPTLHPGDGSRGSAGEPGPRVLRGGCWINDPQVAKSAYRTARAETDGAATNGVRPIRLLIEGSFPLGETKK